MTVNPPVLDTNGLPLPLVLINTSLLQNGQSYTLSPSSTDITSLVQPSDNVIVKRVVSTSPTNDVTLQVNVSKYTQTITVHDVPANYSLTVGVQELTQLQTLTNQGYFVYDGNSKVYMRFYIGVINNLGDIVTNFSNDIYLKNGLKVSLTIPNRNNGTLFLFQRVENKMVYQSHLEIDTTTPVYEATVTGVYEFDVRSNTLSDNPSSWWIITVFVILGVILAFGLLYWIVTTYYKGYDKTMLNVPPPQMYQNEYLSPDTVNWYLNEGQNVTI